MGNNNKSLWFRCFGAEGFLFFRLMAKNLPYFKFIVTEWLTGDITFEDLSVQGLFVNVCALYWQRECKLTTEDINRRYKNPELLKQLIGRYLKVKNGNVSIKFLDEQFGEFEFISKRNSKNGKNGGRPKLDPIEVPKSEIDNDVKDSELQKATALSGFEVANPDESEDKAKKSHIEKEKEKELDKEEEEEKIKNKKEILPKDSILPEMVKIWFEWYEFNFQVKPKFSKVDGAKLKSIRIYLESVISAKQSLTDELLYDGFRIVLEYSLKHEFVSKNLSLAIIDMKMNEIIALTMKRTDKGSKQNDAMQEALRISELKYNKDNGIRNLEH